MSMKGTPQPTGPAGVTREDRVFFRALTAALAMCGMSVGITAAQQRPSTPDGTAVLVAGCVERAERNGSLGGTIVGTSATPGTAPREANSGEVLDVFLL